MTSTVLIISALSLLAVFLIWRENDKRVGAKTTQDELKERLCTAESDADRLAPIVRQYVKDIDDTAALLKDESPPPLFAEREALRLHDEALKLRTK